ncbi:adenylate/guanylate cyclase domain-containing protein [Streptomyces fractus]|uniref:adenylate/guanylate cyclase domain-containing protein n=1 Tax=Streptomyces fractus TaxID=641806 RepID=UPI003CE76D15
MADREGRGGHGAPEESARITVLLADDNLIVREGVRALLALDPAVEVVGTAADRPQLLAEAERLRPRVVVTDIRMPPTFSDEGIECAREIRAMLPGAGVVVLSQYDDPEYAVDLLADGDAHHAYLLKDRVAEPGLLGRAIREVAAGGSMLDPQIVKGMLEPARAEGELAPDDEVLLRMVAEGRSVKSMAAALGQSPGAVDTAVDRLFVELAKEAGAGRRGALDRLRRLHTAIASREEQRETLSRMLPGGVAARLAAGHGAGGPLDERTERLMVTVLMSDVRGYSGIAEHTDPAVLAGQLNAHREAMNEAVLGLGGTVMQYVGDAVMAVFGAPDPQPDHAARAARAALRMHRGQELLNRRWQALDLALFGLGVGLSTGEVAAALLGSPERLEYTLVGDTVNLAQRMESLARPAGSTVASEATVRAAGADGAGEASGLERWQWRPMGPRLVKGRTAPVAAYRLESSGGPLDVADDQLSQGIEELGRQPDQ